MIVFLIIFVSPLVFFLTAYFLMFSTVEKNKAWFICYFNQMFLMSWISGLKKVKFYLLTFHG